MEEAFRRQLVKKYLWAGKIRFISAVIFFVFFILLKFLAGYSYLNSYIISLLLVEAFLNQPYSFFLKRVDIYRFQFYQILVDLIAISWFVYYLGGREAPLITLGYYAVILWAGFISGVSTVIFATLTSAFLFSFIVLGSFFKILPCLDSFKINRPWGDTFSFLLGNLSFLFAFGYFSAKSSSLIKSLEREKFKDFLSYNNKALILGHLFSGFIHDTVNYLLSIRGYIEILSEKFGQVEELKKLREKEEKLRKLSSEMLSLSQGSGEPEDFRAVSPNQIIEEVLELTQPLLKMDNFKVEKVLTAKKEILVREGVLKEVLVSIILQLSEELGRKCLIRIFTREGDGLSEVIFEKVKRGLTEKKREHFYWSDTFSFKKELLHQLVSQLKAELKQEEDKIVIKFKLRDEESPGG